MGFKKVFIIIIWLFISQVILSQVNQDISFTIEQDTLYFIGNHNIQIEDVFSNKYFTNHVELKIRNNTNKKIFLPINFQNLHFTGKFKTLTEIETEDIQKYRDLFWRETFLTPVVNILDENHDLIIQKTMTCVYYGQGPFSDYKEPVDEMSECLLLSKKVNESSDSLFVLSYDETQEYLSKNFMTLDPYDEITLDIRIDLNQYSDRVYLSLEKDKTYTMQMFYFNYEEFKENISPRILDYFEKKGYKMWTGEVQSNTVKLISFDRLKCCK